MKYYAFFTVIVLLACAFLEAPVQPQPPKLTSQQEAFNLQDTEDSRVLLIDDDASLKILFNAIKDIKDPWLRALIKKDLLNRYQEQVTHYKAIV